MSKVSRRVSMFICGLSVLFMFAFVSQAKELKVGVVDVEHIYSSYGKAKTSSGEIQTKKEAKQIELAKKQTDLQVLLDEYNKKKDKMKEAEKQDYEKRVRDLRTEIITFTRLSNEVLTTENRQLIQKHLNEIAAAIQDYAKKNGFDMIVDKKSLPFFSDALNLTADIIKTLNR